MVQAMDRMDMDTDKPMVLQMLNSLLTPIQSVKKHTHKEKKQIKLTHLFQDSKKTAVAKFD